MTNTTTTCDGCYGLIELIKDGGVIGYYLTLMATPRLRASSSELPALETLKAIAIAPPLKRAHHFCTLTCLGNWLEKQ